MLRICRLGRCCAVSLHAHMIHSSALVKAATTSPVSSGKERIPFSAPMSPSVETLLRAARDKNAEPLLNLRRTAANLSTTDVVELFRQLRSPRSFSLDGRKLAYSVLVDRATELQSKFSVQELLEIMSCLPIDETALGNADFGFASVLTAFVDQKMEDFSPRDIARALRGLNSTSQGNLKPSAMLVMHKLCAVARKKAMSFEALDIVQTIDCVVGLDREETELLVALSLRARQILPNFEGGELADIVYNLSLFRCYHVSVPLMIDQALTFMAPVQETRENLHKMRTTKNQLVVPTCLLPKHMVKLLSAMTEFNDINTRVAKLLCAKLIDLIDFLQFSDAVKLLVALAELQEHEAKRISKQGPNAYEIGEDYEKTLVEKTWKKLQAFNSDQASPFVLDRIARTHFALTLEHPDWPLPVDSQLGAAIQPGALPKPPPQPFRSLFSALHKEVCHTLSAMNVEYENEHHIGVLQVDTALVREKICFEVNGPSHFDRLSHLRTGKTQLKRRMLTNLGWKVVNIDFFEWHRYKTAEARQKFLRQLLTPLLPLHGLGLA